MRQQTHTLLGLEFLEGRAVPTAAALTGAGNA